MYPAEQRVRHPARGRVSKGNEVSAGLLPSQLRQLAARDLNCRQQHPQNPTATVECGSTSGKARIGFFHLDRAAAG